MSTNLKAPWRHLVWNCISVPKHRFVSWLAAKQKLRTKDKLLRLGLVKDDLCPLCSMYPETTKHLFFQCPFSVWCIFATRGWVGVMFLPVDMMDFRKTKMTCFQMRVLCAIYAAVIYHIWMNRNTALWKGFVSTPQQDLDTIQLIIRDCLAALYPTINDNRISSWMQFWMDCWWMSFCYWIVWVFKCCIVLFTYSCYWLLLGWLSCCCWCDACYWASMFVSWWMFCLLYWSLSWILLYEICFGLVASVFHKLLLSATICYTFALVA